MASIAEKVDGYFIELEWPFERLDDGLWRTAYPGDMQIHQVFVSTDDPQWLSLRTMVAEAPPSAAQNLLYAHLLRLNALIPMTKFGISPTGEVYAYADLPTADLDFSEFRTAVRSLVNHVDACDNEILRIIAEPTQGSSIVKAGINLASALGQS